MDKAFLNIYTLYICTLEEQVKLIPQLGMHKVHLSPYDEDSDRKYRLSSFSMFLCGTKHLGPSKDTSILLQPGRNSLATDLFMYWNEHHASMLTTT